jgi:hypothetical protein
MGRDRGEQIRSEPLPQRCELSRRDLTAIVDGAANRDHRSPARRCPAVSRVWWRTCRRVQSRGEAWHLAIEAGLQVHQRGGAAGCLAAGERGEDLEREGGDTKERKLGARDWRCGHKPSETPPPSS